MLNRLIPEKNIKNLGQKGIPFAVEKQALIERKSWRTFKPVVDYRKCIKCGMCWLHCPDSAYSFNAKGLPECDGKVCKGCLLCIQVCPAKAITAEQERGLKEK